jgi:hypothetical protein
LDSLLLDSTRQTIQVPASLVGSTSVETTTTFEQLFGTGEDAATIVNVALALLGR